MSGISYYAMNQYQVAALQPPSLHAICAWRVPEITIAMPPITAASSRSSSPTGIPRAAMTMQHGVGERGMRSAVTGELVAGPETLSPEALARNRSDIVQRALEHPLDDAYHRERSPDWAKRHRADAVGRQLGRARPPHPRQLRGFSPCRVHAEMAGGSRRYPLDRILQCLRPRSAEAFFRVISSRAKTPAGTDSRVWLLNIRHPDGTMVPRAEKRMAACPHPLDPLLAGPCAIGYSTTHPTHRNRPT